MTTTPDPCLEETTSFDVMEAAMSTVKSWTTFLENVTTDLDDVTTMSTTTTADPTISKGQLAYIRLVTSIMMAVTVAMVNLAMGAALGKREMMTQWRLPGGILVGCLTQFLLFPLACFGMSLLFKLDGPYAIGMILVGISPGGSMSNLVTFFVDGNLGLSTSMTLVTTVVSLGFVPTLLFLYTRSWYTGPVGVSFWSIGLAISLIAIPLAMGMLIRAFKETWAKVVIVVGLTAGLLAFTANALVHLIINTELIHAPVKVYFAALFLPVVGYLMGLSMALLFGQHPQSRHTLAIETVFHNTFLGIIVLTTSFSNSPNWRQMVIFPALYGPIAAIYGLVYIIVYLAVVAKREGKERPSNPRSFLSGYEPIDEDPSVNREYMALEGEDHDVVVELRDRGSRLQLTDAELAKVGVFMSPMSVSMMSNN